MAILTAAVAFAVRVPFFDWPLTVDEAGYAYGARWWFDGVTMYSDELWFDRPQGIFIAYESGMAFLGGSTAAIRGIGAIWAMAITVSLVLLGARMFSLRTAAIAGVLFAVVSTAPRIDGFTSNAELFMLAGTTFSAYCLWRRWWLAAGLALGVGVVLKPSAGVGLILGIYWLMHLHGSRRDWAFFLGGTAVPMALALGHGVLTVGFYDYLHATVLFRLGTGGERNPFAHMLSGISRTSSVIFPFVIVVLAGRRTLRAWPEEYRFLSAWLALSMLGVAMGGNWWDHYFQQLIPPFAVMVAVVADAAVGRIGSAVRVPGWSAWQWARVPRFALPVAAIGAFSFSFLVLPWIMIGPENGPEIIYGTNTYRRNEEIAEYLARGTEPTDQIYVGISHASLVYLTDRMSSSPYLYRQQTAEIPGAMDEIVDEIEAGVPAVVFILPRQLELDDPDGLIRAALDDKYVYDRSFWDSEVWRRR